MYDPIRYYLAEGHMCLFSFRDEKTPEKLRGIYQMSEDVAGKLKLVQSESGKWLFVDKVFYPITNDFFKIYGTMCDSEDEAVFCSQAWTDDLWETCEHFDSIKKHLVDA